MKKIFMILVVALVAMTCVFASFDTKKLSVGVGAGVSDDVVQIYGRDYYFRGHADSYGFDLAVRGDYALKGDTAVTAMFNWNIDSTTKLRVKHDFFAKYTPEVKVNTEDEHFLGLMVGLTKTIPVSVLKASFTVGPEARISCTTGDFDLGIKGVIKGSYTIPNSPLSVDLTAMGDIFFVVGNKWFTNYNTEEVKHFFINNAFLLGCTYSF